MSSLIVESIDLRKTYTGRVNVPVLVGIDMEIREGEFVAVMGQSGSGKSTLLNLLGCLDRPTGGILRIAGLETFGLEDDTLAELRSDQIGFVFQSHFLLDEFTCLENTLLPSLIRHGGISRQQRKWVLELLDRVGLAGQLHQTPNTMSGGQCQRCAIVRALCNQPRLILADEPTGNLDSQSGSEVFSLLKEMNRETGVAIVMVTHDDRLARQASRILLIEDGAMREISAHEASRPVVSLH